MYYLNLAGRNQVHSACGAGSISLGSFFLFQTEPASLGFGLVWTGDTGRQKVLYYVNLIKCRSIEEYPGKNRVFFYALSGRGTGEETRGKPACAERMPAHGERGNELFTRHRKQPKQRQHYRNRQPGWHRPEPAHRKCRSAEVLQSHHW